MDEEKRKQLEQSLQKRGLNSFEFNYMIPGMTRLIQSAGRVIRSETDRGLVILIDPRFTQGNYLQLLPQHWQIQRQDSLVQCLETIQEFSHREK